MSISKTRNHLIEVARNLFAEKGMEATTMNDIAQASGKGRRTLYTYFSSKEKIYLAVIEEELTHLSETMDEVASLAAPPREKLFRLIYTHLNMIRDVVQRNGSLRAEFFRNIWTVERVRRTFDVEEIAVLRRVLQEGVDAGDFHISAVDLYADIFHYALKGIEVPFIYDRIGTGLTEEDTYPIVQELISKIVK